MRRFHKKALECCDLMDEGVLVNVCLHGMTKEYRIFLENLSSSFSKLMEETQHTNELMCSLQSLTHKPGLGRLPWSTSAKEEATIRGPQ